MGLESGTYIDSLNSSNPAAGDAVNEGDDHLRLIKSTVKATFPNVSGAVTIQNAAVDTLCIFQIMRDISADTQSGAARL